MSPHQSFIVALLFAALVVRTSNGVSVLGIDIGGEWFKLALVTAGAYDIVLNEQSGRRTPNLLAFYQNERFFGNEAKPLVK
jgi:molecular chaperone DnaK (HSP70)